MAYGQRSSAVIVINEWRLVSASFGLVPAKEFKGDVSINLSDVIRPLVDFPLTTRGHSQSALNLERRLRCCQEKSHCRVHRYRCSGFYRLRNSGGGGRDGAADKPLAHEHWIVAFANILFQKEIHTPGELAKKMDEVAARYSGETTPCS